MSNNQHSDDSIFIGDDLDLGEDGFSREQARSYTSGSSQTHHHHHHSEGGSHRSQPERQPKLGLAKLKAIFEDSSLGSMMYFIAKGPVGKLLVFMLVVFITVFILPRFSVFSHVIDTEANVVSTADATNVNGNFIEIGAENESVVKLQKALYTLKYLGFDQINGTFDTASLNALNNYLGAVDNKETGCSYEVYEKILNQAEGISPPAPTANTAPTAGGEDSPEQTEPQPEQSGVKMVRVTAATTRIRRDPVAGSFAYYLLVKGDEFKYLSETTDASGNLWYKMEYNNEVSGWAIASDLEVFMQ